MLNQEYRQKHHDAATDITTDGEHAALLGNDNNEAFNIGEALSNHDSILQYSTKIAIYWLIIDMAYWFFYCAIWYLWLLFARYLGEHNSDTIAWSVNALFVIQAASILFWATMGDKYTYDKIALISCVLTFIGLALESCAFNFKIFLMGSVVTALFRSLNALTMGIITKYLPSKTAIKLMSYRYSILSAGSLLGPVIGGFITYFINIRYTFVFATVISFISILVMFGKINGTQKHLINNQLNIKYLYDYIARNASNINISINNEDREELLLLSNEDYQFPINTETYKSQQTQSNTKKYYEWYMTIMITLANGCLFGTEGVISTFYVVFCLDLFNIQPDISTLHVAVYSLFFILACLVVPKIVNKYKNTNNLVFEYVVIICGHISVIIVLCLYKPCIQSAGSIALWYLMGLTGFCNGLTNMSQEIILLSIQPKRHAAKIAGFKVFMRYFARAMACFFVALYWDDDYYWLIYGQLILYSFSLFCMIGMIVAEFISMITKVIVKNT